MNKLTFTLSGCDTAVCGGVTVKCPKSPVTKLARKWVQQGHDIFALVRVMRNGTQVFKTAPLWVFARVVASEPASSSVKFSIYRVDPRFASPAAPRVNARPSGEVTA